MARLEHDDKQLLLSEESVGQTAAARAPTRFGRHTTTVIGVVVFGVVLFIGSRWPPSHAEHSRSAASAITELAQKHHTAKVEHDEKKASKADADGEQGASRACSGLGENCSATKCCKGDGMQCYQKDAGWAECKASCVTGPDPSAMDGWPWDCLELGPRSKGVALNCSKIGEDCSKSQCCADPGLQCYEKTDGWAACKAACYPGMDLTDADPNPWTCKKLGRKTPGMGPWVQKQCAAPGTGCLTKACCSSPGEICYEKNPYYGECLETCQEGWECKTHGQRTPQPELSPWDMPQVIAPWVAETCAKLGENCRESRCCSDGGYQCFEKNSTYGQCKASCKPGPDLYDVDGKHWTCNVLGPQTPGWATEPWKERKNVSAWVAKECGEEYSDDCRTSQCCKTVGNRCFEKDKDWAACSAACVPGHRPGDTGGNWSCKELGPRTRKPWGTPSIFCFSVVQPRPNYEPDLLASQIGTGFGIFACDEFAVFSTEAFNLGEGPDGPIDTVTFVPAPVAQSKDGTAGNAEIFMHVWDAVKGVGKYQGTDWTVKVDPDAVLLPERLRWHLEPHTGEHGYVVNCAKPYMPEGPMMFGALEAFTRSALDVYFNKAGDCTGAMPWKTYGEDLFMGKCIELLGGQRINDFEIYSDGVCTGVDCHNPNAAAFHPKKTPEEWHGCLEDTKNPTQPEQEKSWDDMDGHERWEHDYMESYKNR